MGVDRNNEVIRLFEEVVRLERELEQLEQSGARDAPPQDPAERWSEATGDARERRFDNDVRRHDAWRRLGEACAGAEQDGIAPETIAEWLGVPEPALRKMLEHRTLSP